MISILEIVLILIFIVLSMGIYFAIRYIKELIETSKQSTQMQVSQLDNIQKMVVIVLYQVMVSITSNCKVC